MQTIGLSGPGTTTDDRSTRITEARARLMFRPLLTGRLAERVEFAADLGVPTVCVCADGDFASLAPVVARANLHVLALDDER